MAYVVNLARHPDRSAAVAGGRVTPAKETQPDMSAQRQHAEKLPGAKRIVSSRRTSSADVLIASVAVFV